MRVFKSFFNFNPRIKIAPEEGREMLTVVSVVSLIGAFFMLITLLSWTYPAQRGRQDVLKDMYVQNHAEGLAVLINKDIKNFTEQVESFASLPKIQYLVRQLAEVSHQTTFLDIQGLTLNENNANLGLYSLNGELLFSTQVSGLLNQEESDANLWIQEILQGVRGNYVELDKDNILVAAPVRREQKVEGLIVARIDYSVNEALAEFLGPKRYAELRTIDERVLARWGGILSEMSPVHAKVFVKNADAYLYLTQFFDSSFWLDLWGYGYIPIFLLAVVLSWFCAFVAGRKYIAPQFLELTESLNKLREDSVILEKSRNEALYASQAKSEFLAGMSHEIRTPLNGVVGMAELLSTSELDNDQKEYADVLVRSSRSLLGIINDVLDLSKIEAGRLELDYAQFNLWNLCEDVVAAFAVSARDSQKDIICKIEKDVPKFVVGDPGRLRQILNNLIGNAVKFTEEGFVLLAVKFVKESEDSCYHLEFSVEDTGVGIREQGLKNIFDKFSHDHEENQSLKGGTGLGLSISRQLVEMMGGRINVKSQKNVGSKFTFDIFLGVDEESRHVVPVKPQNLRGLKVLAVDDIKENLQVLAPILTQAEMHVTTAQSVADALGEIRHANVNDMPFDVIITDHHMPKDDGFDLAQYLSGADSITRPPCLILLTSSIDSVGQKNLERAGFNGYALKPIRQEKLLNILSLAWAHSQRHISKMVTEGSADEERRSQEVETFSQPLIVLADGSEPKVLLAEDNRVNETVARIMMEKMGCEVVVAVDGEQAVSEYKNGVYDVVVMDIQMPKLSGWDATAQIRAYEKQNNLKPVPVVAITANTTRNDREKARSVGMDGFIPKPVSAPLIERELRRVLRNKLR